jgi:hypothetical protein
LPNKSNTELVAYNPYNLPPENINRGDLLLAVDKEIVHSLNLIKLGISPLIGVLKSQKEPLLVFNSFSNSADLLTENISENAMDSNLISVVEVSLLFSDMDFFLNNPFEYSQAKKYDSLLV